MNSTEVSSLAAHNTGHVRLTQTSTADQKADFLTMPLKRTLFTRACAALNLT
jgi:hypothetical protein